MPINLPVASLRSAATVYGRRWVLQIRALMVANLY